MSKIKEIVISGDNISVFFATGEIHKATIENLDDDKFENFKKQLKNGKYSHNERLRM